MNLKRIVFILRLVGYSAGVCGLGVVMAARASQRRELFLLGGALLLVMFASLMGTYMVYMASPFRRSRPRPSDRRADG